MYIQLTKPLAKVDLVSQCQNQQSYQVSQPGQHYQTARSIAGKSENERSIPIVGNYLNALTAGKLVA